MFSTLLYKEMKILIFRNILNFKTKCIGGQNKALSFLICTASDIKSTKGGDG